MNGCPDNIAFRYPDGSWKFADGTPSTEEKLTSDVLEIRLEVEKLEKS